MVKMLIEASEGYCPVCGERMGAVMLDEYPRREEQTVTAWVCEACEIDVEYMTPIDGDAAADGVVTVAINPFAS